MQKKTKPKKPIVIKFRITDRPEFKKVIEDLKQMIADSESNRQVNKANQDPIQKNQADELRELKSKITLLDSGIGELCTKIEKLSGRIDSLSGEFHEYQRVDLAADDATDEEIAELKSEIAELKKTYGIFRTVNEINQSQSDRQLPTPVHEGRLTIIAKI